MRILIIDDDLISSKKLEILLEGYGTCDVAETGEQAIEFFKRAHQEARPYQLITLDIGLPDIKGQVVLEKIRTWEKENLKNEEKEVKVLMVTAKSDSMNIWTSFRKGCEGYLKKPFDKENLYRALKKVNVIKA